MPYRVMLVAGTRPELLKVWPVHAAVRTAGRLDVVLVTTGQQPALISETLEDLGITADENLAPVRETGSLPEFAGAVAHPLESSIRRHRPDAVLIQGDTVSAFLAGVVAFWSGVPVVHLEAGLRSDVERTAFPEEAHRRMLANVAALHLAPTRRDRRRLVDEGVPADRILTIGNTVVDTLRKRPRGALPPSLAQLMARYDGLVVVTMHRRESWGAPRQRVAAAVRRLAAAFPRLLFAFQRHPGQAATEASGPANLVVVPHYPHSQFVEVLRRCTLVLSDSGGIQEEVPSLGVPLLILRAGTERPSASTAEQVCVVGTDEDTIVDSATAWLTAPPPERGEANPNPYGDGRAGERAEAALAWLLGATSEPPTEFDG